MHKLTQFFEKNNVIFRSATNKESSWLRNNWLQVFASRVKAAKGEWVFRGYRWHGFSYGIEPCREGQVALSAYLSQWSVPYFVSDESLSNCYYCESERYPDLSDLQDDFYVSHKNLKWTMVFTHEELGPYFSVRG